MIGRKEDDFVGKGRCCSIISKSGMLFMFFIGTAAGTLYYAPSENCSQTECGAFLSNLITQNAAKVVFFMSGAIGYCLSNAYFSAISIPQLFQFMGAQKTYLAKLLNGSGIFLLTAGQTGFMFISAAKTGSNIIETALTTGGSFPGALFASASLMQYEVPYLLSKAKQSVNKVQYHLKKLFHCKLSSSEQHEKEKIDHYRDQYANFMEQLNHQWKFRIWIGRYFEADRNKNLGDDFLQNLYNANAPELKATSCVSTATRLSDFVVNAGIAVFTLNLTATMTNNTWNGVSDWTSDLATNISLTGFLNITNIYNTLFLTHLGINGVYQGIKNRLAGKSFAEDLLDFELYPQLSYCAAIGSVAVEAFSFSLVDIMARTMYEERGIPEPYKNIMYYAAMAGIAICHSAALYQLYKILLRLFTRDPQARELFDMEARILNYSTMSLRDFIRRVESDLINEKVREQYKIELFEELDEKLVVSVPSREDVSIIVSPRDQNENGSEQGEEEGSVVEREDSDILSSDAYQNQPNKNNKESIVPNEKPKGWCDYICTFFRCGKGSKGKEKSVEQKSVEHRLLKGANI